MISHRLVLTGRRRCSVRPRSPRSGLGDSAETAALQVELEEQWQFVLNLKKAPVEREEELGPAP